MSQAIVNSREVQKRLAEVMERYHKSFELVERLVKSAGDLGGLPNFVFAVDRLNEEQLRLLPKELAAAERQRRQERVALHCLVELLALEQLPGVDWTPPTPLQDPSNEAVDLITQPPEDGKTQQDLDRFISIMDFARRHGVIYLNGTFKPVVKHSGNTLRPGEVKAGDNKDV